MSEKSATSAGSAVEERPFRGRVTKREKENNSALPKAVAGERSSEATGTTTNAEVFRAFVKAGQRFAEIHVNAWFALSPRRPGPLLSTL